MSGPTLRALSGPSLAPFAASVREFLAGPAPASQAARDHAEELLTDGCALALVFESDCTGIRAAMADLVERIDEPGSAERLRELTPRMRAAEARLALIRELIAGLQAKRHPPQPG